MTAGSAAGVLDVLMLTEYPYSEDDERLGGIMQASFRLVAALDRVGQGRMRLAVLTVTPRVTVRTEKRLPGGTLIIYRPGKQNLFDALLFNYPSVSRALREEVERAGALLIHAQGTAKYIFAATYASVPNVITIHGIYRNETPVARSMRSLPAQFARHMKIAVEYHYMRRIRHLIAITDEISRAVARASTNVWICRIDNPIDDQFFQVSPIRDDARPVVLFVAAITYRKGLDLLLRAFDTVLTRVPSATLRIAGIWDWDPEYVDRLRSDYRRRVDAGEVAFLGGLSQGKLIQEMTDAVVLCLPSRAESAPLVISQAMAAGRPVVASNVGGIPSMVEDGRTGFLSNVGDVEKLAVDLEALLTSQTLARRMGEAGRQDATGRYGSDSVATKTLLAYRSVLQDT